MAQLFLGQRLRLKLNCAFGAESQAPTGTAAVTACGIATGKQIRYSTAAVKARFMFAKIARFSNPGCRNIA